MSKVILLLVGVVMLSSVFGCVTPHKNDGNPPGVVEKKLEIEFKKEEPKERTIRFTTTVPKSGSERAWISHLWKTPIPKDFMISKVFVSGKDWACSGEVTPQVKECGWFRYTESENSFTTYSILFRNQKHDKDRIMQIEITGKQGL